MKNTNFKQTIAVLSVSAALSCSLAWASNIDPANPYAWSENAGWLNFSATNGKVRVFNDHLEGFVWSENVGWIKLGSRTGGGAHSYLNSNETDWGVNNDAATGKLSGYAWSENAGWIKFDSDNGGPVTVDAVTGSFDGYAWGENIGWIHFQNSTPAYQVKLQAADLSVTKKAGDNPVKAGDNLVYTITVTNGGPGIADNIQLEDSLPAGLTYVSLNTGTTGWNCNNNAGTVTCSLDTLAASSAAAIELTVSTSSALEESLTNTAIASLYGPDSDLTNNSGSDTTYFGLGDMSCSGYDAEVDISFGPGGEYLCVGRNTLKTVGEVNVLENAIVHFQSPATTLDKKFKVHEKATFTSGNVGNVTPLISGPAELPGILGDTLDFTLTHACEDYEDGVIAIDQADSGILAGSPGNEVFSISCTDLDGKVATKLVTVEKVE